ncbi:hypothetical protein [Pseudolabrys sp. FHR47]|uniref:hypothetical protein n=1 Tax=Pseudolabrys sp. FHR47 TaxID=2562284 RepID=UPI0010BE7BB4|nr:hypothetical protein [Pseudolabrys sp. FHR47]
MRKTLLGAAFTAIGFVAMTAAASAQVCVLGIFGAAIYVAATEKRELTQKEAMTCGLSRMFDDKKAEQDTAKTKGKNAKANKTARAKASDKAADKKE